jgi:DNA-binding CsgD family transcriptional regulator
LIAIESQEDTESWEFSARKSNEALLFLTATFDLLNDEITGPQWLENLAALAGCRSITCVWWPVDYPEKMIAEVCGRQLDLSKEQLRTLNKAIATAPNEPTLLYELPEQTSSMASDHQNCGFRSDQLIACIDWWPANVLLIFNDRLHGPDWTLNDRQRLKALLPIIRRSLTVKKRLSKLADAIELSNKIMDEIPRGFITLMPDSEILGTNRFAEILLDKGMIFERNGKQMQFKNEEVQHEFQNQLQKICALSKDQLNEFVWYKNLSSSAAKGSLMATVFAFGFDHMRTESTRFDRVALIILEQQGLREVAGEKQLTEFYQLTKAQARLLHAIMQNNSIEEAASTLHISINTARSHLRAIYERLGVNNISQLLHITNATLTAYTRPE